MDISACPQCASRALHVPNISDGGVAGYSTTVEVACSDCGYAGAPLLMDRVAYEEFRHAVREGAQAPIVAAPEVADPAMRELLDTPRSGSPPGSSRVSAAFIALLGLAGLVAIPMAMLVIFAEPGTGEFPVIPLALALPLQGLEIWAVWRIARRMWNGSGASSPAT